MRYVLVPRARVGMDMDAMRMLEADEEWITPSMVAQGRHRGKRCTDWRSVGFSAAPAPIDAGPEALEIWLGSNEVSPEIPDAVVQELLQLTWLSTA